MAQQKSTYLAVQDHEVHGKETASGNNHLSYRVGHPILEKALRNLNPAQHAAVGEMGFANLQHLHINDLPAKFAYWILSKFDPRSSELILDERRTLPIDATDVWLTLGIPNGPISLLSKRKRSETALLLEWKDRVGNDPTRIRTTDIREVMLREIDGGVWFRRHFLILMSLSPSTYIFSAVIDVWCAILNHVESYRSPQSPLRFFASTYPCVSLLLIFPCN